MFVAEDGRDGGNSIIRKVTPEAVVTTYAGSGEAEREDGTGIEASFRHPGGMAIDENNDIYVGDWGNNLIRKVSEHQSLLKVPSQYSSIKTAIKFALAGDTVLVADGTYTENLNIDKDIKIISENGESDSFFRSRHIMTSNQKLYATILGGMSVGSAFSGGLRKNFKSSVLYNSAVLGPT